MDDEENLSTEPAGAQATPWISRPHGHEERPQGAQPAAREGAEAPLGVTDPMIERLKKRRDFLAVARGHRAPRRAFVLEALRRADDGPARIGFTVSKRTAKKAVERNRIRRRLREAARLSAGDARAGHDYVIVGRRAALTEPFDDLKSALVAAMRKLPEATAGARQAPA